MPIYSGSASGLVGTLGVTVVDDATGAVVVARSTAGITEPVAGSAVYWHAAPAVGQTLVWTETAGGYGAADPPAPDNAGIAAAKATAEAVKNAYIGSGDKQVRLVVKNTLGVAIGDAEVLVSSDAAGDTVICGPVTTNAQGKTPVLMLNAGTYYRWASKSGETFTNPQPFTVA